FYSYSSYDPSLRMRTVRFVVLFFFSSRRRHTRSKRDWSSDVCSSDLKRGSVFESGYDQDRHPGTDRIRVRYRGGCSSWQSHVLRSEERRVGKECRSRWSEDHRLKKRLRTEQSGERACVTWGAGGVVVG